MKRIDLKSVALGLLIGGAAVFSMGAVGGTRPVEFEYKVVAGKVWGRELEQLMNGVGPWELVSVEPFAEQHAFAVFRRPKE
jgi:hypothetical protein